MKSPLSPRRRSTACSLEPLEARIAPARIITVGSPDINGVHNPNFSTNYNDTVGQSEPGHTTGPIFHDTAHPAADDTIAQQVGGYADPTSGKSETFYITLVAGDTLQVSSNTGAPTKVLTVNSGIVVAFFENKDFLDSDTNEAEKVHLGDLVSLSVTKNASVTLRTAIDGSIVTNLNADGKSLDLNDLVSPSQGISNILEQGGDIGGKILSGGTISKATLKGVSGIFAGTGALGQSYSFFPTLADPSSTAGQGVITALSPTTMTAQGLLAPNPGQAGASIKHVTLDSVGSIIAGAGGIGAVGGSITNLNIGADTNGFTLIAGAGGAGDATMHRANAGAGGSITSVYIQGPSGAPDATLNDLITATAGVGGAAPDGTGGHGGNVTQFNVGFGLVGGKLFTSKNFLADDVLVQGGHGGDGKIGGGGGSLSTVRLTTSTDFDAAHAGQELALRAGDGGNSTFTSTKANTAIHAGAGGSITTANILNQAEQVQLDVTPNASDASTVIQAGSAGAVTGVATGATPTAVANGANGGSISGLKLLGSNLIVTAGNGSDGLHGGSGGSLKSLRVLQDSAVFTHLADFNAGVGGNGSNQSGGAGGVLAGLVIDSSDFTGTTPGAGLNINTQPGAGNGGNSVSGKGGAGGSVSGLNIVDENSAPTRTDLTPRFALGTINAGSGGAGKTGGGAGGTIKNSALQAVDMSFIVHAGQGGAGLVDSAGGAGGKINVLQITASGSSSDSALDQGGHTITPGAILNPAFATVISGSGGNGTTTGGSGGGISFVEINVDGNDSGQSFALDANHDLNVNGSGSLIAGNGGTGGTGGVSGVGPKGAAGAGGGIFASGVFAAQGPGILSAGNAGLTGAKPGAGGSIKGASNIALSGLYASSDVLVTAGNGGAGGAGGSIANFGYGAATADLTPVPNGNIIIHAGNGSAYQQSATTTAYAGAGGSISNVSGSVSRGLDTVTSITAGEGGGALRADGSGLGVSKAGAGGSISGLRIQRGPTAQDITFPGETLSTFTITAGDAGDAQLYANSGNVPFTNTVVTGAHGGSVSGVVALDIGGNETIFRSVSGGDGGPGIKQGGGGGSVTSVRVAGHDIGVRSGQIYGYDTMGGIFAGVGGAGNAGAATGVTTGKAGLAGNVTNISADSISAIAAGKSNAPQLANTVSNIILNDVTVKTDVGLPPLRSTDNTSLFTLTVNGTTTDVLPGNATPAQVHDAILQATGLDTTVTAPANAQYQITFNQIGDQQPITVNRFVDDQVVRLVPGTIATPETQEVQPLGVGTFSLSFEGANTGELRAHAPATDVQNALVNAGVSAAVTDGPHGSYIVHFNSTGPQELITSTEVTTTTATTVTQGSIVGVGAKEVQNLSFPLLRGVDPIVFQLAGISDGTGTIEVDPVNVGDAGTGTAAMSVPVTADQVANALNANSHISDAGGVTVTLLANNTFDIHFKIPANAIDITASDILPTTVVQTNSGLGNNTVVASMEQEAGDGMSRPEIQHVVFDRPIQQFSLSYTGIAGDSTPKLAYGDSAQDVQDKLNILAVQDNATYTVSVTSDNAGGYFVTYSDFDPHSPLLATEYNNTTQTVNLSTLTGSTAATATHFTLTADSAGGGSVTTTPLDLHASPAEVQAALAAAGATEVSVTGGAGGTYNLEYTDGASHNLASVSEINPLTSSTTFTSDTHLPTNGDVVLSYVRQITFDPTVDASAHIVGAIAGYNQLGADRFEFVKTLSSTAAGYQPTFQLGDIAVDGLVAAKNFSQRTVNFTPQARLIVNSDVNSGANGVYKPVDPNSTATNPIPVFFDFDNQI